jgi:hypothetical protein
VRYLCDLAVIQDITNSQHSVVFSILRLSSPFNLCMPDSTLSGRIKMTDNYWQSKVQLLASGIDLFNPCLQ